MNLLSGYCRDLERGTLAGWNRFWFSPTDPATLGMIRLFAGAMLFYTHLVWSHDLNGFFGDQAWLTPATINKLPGASPFQWSYFYWIHSPALLWTAHIAALIVFALLTVGLWSRTMSVLAFLATVSYAHRASLTQFGLDDTNCMLAMYLMVGPCGAAYSVDRWLQHRRTGGAFAVAPSIGANIAIRLLQVHLCVEYFFSGIGKAQGPLWWNGDAILMATANLEYQSLGATWLIHYRALASMLTHITVFWELTYCTLVWPRLTRPIVIAIGIGMHLGIGLFLGMWTFGLAMIIANLSFVSPWIVRRLLDRQSEPQDGADSQKSSDRQTSSGQKRPERAGSSKPSSRSGQGAGNASLTAARL
ncbi:MAG TPA: HTTM domain-containing protein [Pirellulales bacterium]|jgi:membrane protein implicated in regulation of membrane protease activity|nr:HTTM domain-containing protein [Pirellulales bacterium]